MNISLVNAARRATDIGHARAPHRSMHTTIGLDPVGYGTHSIRRTKVTLIYQRTRNLRAIHLLLGHSKLERTVRKLGIELEDELDIPEKTEV